MPSPRSKRTTAMRPSGPRPFSMVTNFVMSQPPACYYPRTALQMSGPTADGFVFRCRKTDRGPDRDPAGVFAGNIMTKDDVDRENLVRPIAHAALESRPHRA